MQGRILHPQPTRPIRELPIHPTLNSEITFDSSNVQQRDILKDVFFSPALETTFNFELHEADRRSPAPSETESDLAVPATPSPHISPSLSPTNFLGREDEDQQLFGFELDESLAALSEQTSFGLGIGGDGFSENEVASDAYESSQTSTLDSFTRFSRRASFCLPILEKRKADLYENNLPSPPEHDHSFFEEPPKKRRLSPKASFSISTPTSTSPSPSPSLSPNKTFMSILLDTQRPNTPPASPVPDFRNQNATQLHFAGIPSNELSGASEMVMDDGSNDGNDDDDDEDDLVLDKDGYAAVVASDGLPTGCYADARAEPNSGVHADSDEDDEPIDEDLAFAGGNSSQSLSQSLLQVEHESCPSSDDSDDDDDDFTKSDPFSRNSTPMSEMEDVLDDDERDLNETFAADSDNHAELAPPRATRMPTIYQTLTKASIDWCRYCGTTEGVNWRPGPWGKRTLCNKHGCDYKGYGFACKLPRLDLTGFTHETIDDRDRPVLQLFCQCCHKQESHAGNVMVRCEGCWKAYHQRCYSNVLPDDLVSSDQQWFCDSACRENMRKKRIVVELPRKRLPLMSTPKVSSEPLRSRPSRENMSSRFISK